MLAKSKKNVTALLYSDSVFIVCLFVFNHSTVFGSPGGSGGFLLPELPQMKTVRAFFPETWIWDLVEVGYAVFCWGFFQ